MITFYVEKDGRKHQLQLNENLNIKEALYLVFNMYYDYGYINRYQHVEKLNKTFKEANILNGETIRIIA